MATTPDPRTTPSHGSVSVLGLGAMGRALAGAFLASGHPTTTWNRTPGRAGDLVERGAVEATSAADALAASSITVVCLLDSEAVDAVLDGIGDRLAGTTIVNLTSSTPEQARATAARATRWGARYLDGKIMVPTPLVGTADGFVLYSGDRAVFDEHRVELDALGGDADLLGDDPGRAAVYDLGMLDVFFNGMSAFLHASALVGANGVSAAEFLPYADRIVSVLQTTLVGLADDVDRGAHTGDEDNLEMELAALNHIVEASADQGIDVSVPELPRALVAKAITGGHGRDGFSRVIDVLRRSGHRAAVA